MKIDHSGTIMEIRAVEDCIRATKKYTEGLLSRQQHPIQGEDFPSRVLKKHYDIYPTIPEISWNMPVNVAKDWLFTDTPCISVDFRYDYRCDRAVITFHDDNSVNELIKVVPGFSLAILAVNVRTQVTQASPNPVQRRADV